MIDPKSIRIGDIVSYNGMNLQVTSINSPKPDKSERFNNKFVVELLCDGFICCPIEDIEPIPISEEILLKCGFEKYNICYFEKGNIKLEKLLTTPKFILRIKRGRTGSMEIKIVKYLHEIQNWYFLIHEEELQINL